MFTELLEVEAVPISNYANVTNAFYPLARIDTINQENGDIDDTSALSLTVYGKTNDHLALLDGILEDILDSKWETFAKKQWDLDIRVINWGNRLFIYHTPARWRWLRWFISLAFFTTYYIFFFTAYMQRPFSMTSQVLSHGAITSAGEAVCFNNTNFLTQTCSRSPVVDYTTLYCHLLDYGKLPIQQGWLRLVCESVVVLLVVLQILSDVSDVRRIGRQKWLNIYKAFPAKILYKISWLLVLLAVPMRFLCRFGFEFTTVENHLVSYAVVLTTAHFLFYCRALKFIGPFVLMIYTIIDKDLRRFIIIYIIIMIGFSQSFYAIFFACEEGARNGDYPNATAWDNIMDTFDESIIRTFIMTIGEFMVFYRTLNACPKPVIAFIGKCVFLVFELCVSILQLNLLIAMMTKTYEAISKTKTEYKRQWAKVILMLEVSLKPQDRLQYLMQYSAPTGINKNIRSFQVTKKIDPRNLTEHEREMREKQRKEVEDQKKILRRRKKVELEQQSETAKKQPLLEIYSY